MGGGYFVFLLSFFHNCMSCKHILLIRLASVIRLEMRDDKCAELCERSEPAMSVAGWTRSGP